MSKVIDNKMSDELAKLVKNYVELQPVYEDALKVVERYKAIREQIKENFEQQHIQCYSLNQDGFMASLEYIPTVQTRVDTKNLPPEIRSRYTKQITVKREKLTVYKRPRQ
jgi:hypothetical protein